MKITQRYLPPFFKNQGLSLTPLLVDAAFWRFLTLPPVDDAFALSTIRGGGWRYHKQEKIFDIFDKWLKKVELKTELWNSTKSPFLKDLMLFTVEWTLQNPKNLGSIFPGFSRIGAHFFPAEFYSEYFPLKKTPLVHHSALLSMIHVYHHSIGLNLRIFLEVWI